MAALATSINGLLYSLGVYFRDAYRGRVTTAGTATTFTDARLALGVGNEEVNRYAGSEVYWETTTGMTATANPSRVRAYNEDTGLITFTPTWGATPPLGAEYVLQNIGGNGWPHAVKLEAIAQVLRDLGVLTRAKVSIASPDQVDYWNAIPAGIDSVYRVEAVDGAGRRSVLAPAFWRRGINVGDRSIFLPYDTGDGVTFDLYGRVAFTDPTDFTTAISGINPDRVVRAAAERLVQPSGTSQDRRIYEGLYADRMRQRRDLPLSNEVWLRDTL